VFYGRSVARVGNSLTAGDGDGVARLVGRSSSHFTRVVRIFAEELGVPYQLQVVPSLMAADADMYGGNPGLRMPSLLIPGQPPAFGCLNSCRTLAELSTASLDLLWPEALIHSFARNAQELTLQSMSTEVTLIMIVAAGGADSAYAVKLRTALEGMLLWLDEHVERAMGDLPARDLSFLEVALFCLIDHLPFRKVLSIERYANLRSFRDRFSSRPSAIATPFRFDT
jgi:glutathione S-transferase